MMNIIVSGSRGRMGQRVVELVRGAKDLSLVADIDREDSLEGWISRCDVVIDFSVPSAASGNAKIAAKHKKPIVIGTTGLNEIEKGAVWESARFIPIVFAPNMSVGVNVMLKAVELAAKALGRQFKVDIVETHHIHKLDKPSGTAKKILDTVIKESGRRLEEDVFVHEDATNTEKENADMDVSIRSVRRGEVIGDHIVHFSSPGEILTIEHHAITRDIFAEGAIVAARWIKGKPAGLYGMDDVLGLKK